MTETNSYTVLPTDTDLPADTARSNLLHDARIRVQMRQSDTAQASYETLVLRAVGPSGITNADTDSLIGAPYQLLLEPGMRVETLSAPDLPMSVAEVSDLTQQFYDFFPLSPPVFLKLA